MPTVQQSSYPQRYHRGEREKGDGACWVRFDLADQLEGPPSHTKSDSDGEQSIHDVADRRRSCRVVFAVAPRERGNLRVDTESGEGSRDCGLRCLCKTCPALAALASRPRGFKCDKRRTRRYSFVTPRTGSAYGPCAGQRWRHGTITVQIEGNG
jgi:hypothetical protein